MAEFDNMFAVARAAERGAGIALLPLLVCEPWFASGALAQIEGFELQSDEAYYLVARREDVARPEVQAFIQWTVDSDFTWQADSARRRVTNDSAVE